MAQWHGGKGSSQRKVDKKKYNDNWDRIFKKKLIPI
jgi:stalled ribosome alternative rescue factor ArfA